MRINHQSASATVNAPCCAPVAISAAMSTIASFIAARKFDVGSVNDGEDCVAAADVEVDVTFVVL